MTAPYSPYRAFPPEWGLSPAQDRILARMLIGGPTSKKVIAYIACPKGMGSLEAVKAQISYLRRALRQHPVQIYNIRGWGYALDQSSRDYLKRH